MVMTDRGDTRTPMSEAILRAYEKGQEDETLEPLVLTEGGRPVGRMRKGEPVIFYNIRGEREIQLTRAFTEKGFGEFERDPDFVLPFVTMVEYDRDLPVRVAFPPLGDLHDTFAEVLDRRGMRFIKIVESEKAVHMTFYINGKVKRQFDHEDRLIIDSPKDVRDFDEKPEMNIDLVSEAIREKLAAGEHRVIMANFANTDVVGHIEDEGAIIRAVEAVDREAGRVIDAARENGYHVVITADHGTVEKWYYPEGAIDTGHTTSPVPFLWVPAGGDGDRWRGSLRSGGALTDVAPTMLDLLGIEPPEVMTGRSLIEAEEIENRGAPLLLLILDGWGYREESHGNLIHKARTPNMDALMETMPMTLLHASGEPVGLPEGTVGNSEAGHLHIGSGRRVASDRLRLEEAMADGSFHENEAFLEAMRRAKEEGLPLHLLGIVSFYSSHGSIKYLFSLLELARREGLEEVYVHSLLGRRGERPESGARYVGDIEREAARLGVGRVVSVIGRYWALDREEHWGRVEKAFRMLVDGRGEEVRAG
jgi:2,3-bisphosphoglycerate-independent phosphoglycerate mutase